MNPVTWLTVEMGNSTFRPFVTSNVSYKWCTEMQMELFEIRVMEQVLRARGRPRSKVPCCRCFGVNDGFYTMLLGAAGCHVHAFPFDVQDVCNDIARETVPTPQRRLCCQHRN